MITIRVAEAKDYKLLADLGRRAFFEAFGQFSNASDMNSYLDKSFDPQNIKNQLTDPASYYLIANFSGEDAGYAKMKKNYCPKEISGDNCIQIERIYALQDYIGMKVGKTLMEECMSYAVQNGYKNLWLGVWQENKRAIDFYKKWGFEVIGYKQFIIGNEVNEDFVMAVKL